MRAMSGWSWAVLVALAPALVVSDQADTPGRERILARFEPLRQPDWISCGPTCAAMVLRYYGCDESAAWVGLGRPGRRLALMSPTGLGQLLADGGVDASVLSGGPADLTAAIDSGRPAILLARIGPLMWHYVVVIGYRDGAFLLADPLGRHSWVDVAALDLSWSFDGDLEGRAIGGGPGSQSPDAVRQGLERLGLTPHLMILPAQRSSHQPSQIGPRWSRQMLVISEQQA